MASLNGAKVLGLEHKKGILAVGKDADLVVMNKNFDVRMTIYEGAIKHNAFTAAS
jgi:N-acetylglucosamine-6-phosphate deacetylase